MERRNIYYKVLEYPVVQYITLRRRILYEEILNERIYNNRIDVRMIQTQSELNSYTKYYNIDYYNKDIDYNNNVVVISINYSIDDTKYRTNRIYTFGDVINGKIQISSISKDLFYRKHLYFLCYNWKGEKIPLQRQVYILK
ncbi:hypothetical protein [Desulfitibacter alkalitolerans]|uniref:hypothetical protein n=1 Tax=Desulfitibacter alkalitolerans TaxID=264641 RepID=UPI000485C4B9|nr:hypothetical protein [Desulfitibacter alkalitolerans]